MNPVRTCVGCRQRASRADLLRVVVNNQILVADLRAVMPGRGAWMHPTRKCLDLAINRRALSRALNSDQKLDAAGLTTHIEQAETMLDNK